LALTSSKSGSGSESIVGSHTKATELLLLLLVVVVVVVVAVVVVVVVASATLWESNDWIRLAQVRDHRKDVVNTVMDPHGP
jgi:hypothetical protein